jgi:hypothetical protein
MRASTYLHLYNVFSVTETEDRIGTGKTMTAYWSESRLSTATAIATTTKTATASNGTYAVSWSRSNLTGALTSLVGRTVYLHLDDGVGAHATYPFLPVLVDPELL